MTINPLETLANASQRLHQVLETSDPLTVKLSSSLSQCIAGLRLLCQTLSDALPHAPHSNHLVDAHESHQENELIALNKRLKELLALEHLGFDDESRLEQAFQDLSTTFIQTHISCKLEDQCINAFLKYGQAPLARVSVSPRSTLQDIQAIFCETFKLDPHPRDKRLFLYDPCIRSYLDPFTPKDLFEGCILEFRGTTSHASTQTSGIDTSLLKQKSIREELQKSLESLSQLRSSVVRFQHEARQAFDEMSVSIPSIKSSTIKDWVQIGVQISTFEDDQSSLIAYVDRLRLDMIQHRVRPGLERISILMQEQARIHQWLMNLSQQTSIPENLIQSVTSMLNKSNQLQHLLKKIQEIVEIQEQNLEIVLLELSYTSHEDSQSPSYKPFLDELDIRLTCFTDIERADGIQRAENMRKWENRIFGHKSLFQRELELVVKRRESCEFRNTDLLKLDYIRAQIDKRNLYRMYLQKNQVAGENHVYRNAKTSTV